MDAIGQICTKSLDGAERTPVLMTPAWQLPNDYSPDGTTLLTFVQTPAAAGDLYTLTLGPKTGDDTLRCHAVRRKRGDVLSRRPMGGLSVERIDAQRGLCPPLSPQH